MKKKIIIGVLAFVVIAALAMVYLNNRNRTLSPPGYAEFANGDFKISVTYNRPSVRGRVLFGTEAQGALQPYGKYWRMGANESTEITFTQDVTFNQQPLKAGTYRMYAIPGESSFEIRLNSALGRWGAFEPDYDLDVLKVNIEPARSEESIEQLTYTIDTIENGNENETEYYVNMLWGTTRLSIPIMPQP